MALDLNALLQSMESAAQQFLAKEWAHVKNFTLPELQKIAATFVDLEQGLVAGRYTRDAATILLRMQLRATQMVLTATTALTLIEIENALEAVMAAVKQTVNGALGFALLA